MARPANRGTPLAERGLEALADAGVALGQARSLNEALGTIGSALLDAAEAGLVVIRALDEARGALRTGAIATGSAAVAAELEGTLLPLEDVPELEQTDLQRLPRPIRHAAERMQ